MRASIDSQSSSGPSISATNRDPVIARSARDPAADVLRGFGVVAVIIFHSYIVVTSSKSAVLLSIDASDLMQFFMRALEPARMPAMMFIAGHFASRSLSRTPTGKFLDKKARGVLYPFFFWSVVYILMKSANSIAKGTLDFDQILEHARHPAAHMWFLGYVFSYFVLVAIFWGRRSFLLGGSLAFLAVTQFTGVTDLNKAIYLFSFFMAGVLLPADVMRRLGELSLGWKVIATLSLFAVVGSLANAGLLESKYEMLAMPISILAVGGMILLAGIIAVAGSPLYGLFNYIGTISLEVYLMHWMAINVICIVLPDFIRQQSGDLVILFVFGTSLAATILAARIVRLLGLNFLFTLPRRRKDQIGRPQSVET